MTWNDDTSPFSIMHPYHTQRRLKVEAYAEIKRLKKRNEWLEEIVALAQEHGAIDLSDYGFPQWEEEE